MKIGRINIITEYWDSTQMSARQVIEEAMEQIKEKKPNILMTPAGFLFVNSGNEKIEKPSLVKQNEDNFEFFKDLAKNEIDRFLYENNFSEKLKKYSDYLLLGIDVGQAINNKCKNEKGKIKSIIGKSGNHAEFAVVIDLKGKVDIDFWWTGKSYPNSKQENKLYRFSNLNSHLKDFGTFGKTIILVCHDLSIFNPRVDGQEKNKRLKEERLKIRKPFRKLVEESDPKLILHPYHVGQSLQTWTQSLNGLNQKVGSIKNYIGCGIICTKAIKDKLNEKKKENSEEVAKVIKNIKENTKVNGKNVADFDIIL